MLQQSKPWLSAVPWPVVVQMNEDLCRTRELPHKLNPKTSETARQLWERASGSVLTLEQALSLCRECNGLIPFTFASDQTFVSIGLGQVEDLLGRLPKEAAVEAQILRNTVSHYVAGLVARGELKKVFRHFESFWARERALKSAAASVAAIQPLVS